MALDSSALQQAIGSAQQEFAAQNPLTQSGLPGVPAAPAPAPLPPSTTSLPTNTGLSGGFNEQLAANQDKLASMQPNASEPGAWARNIVGAVQKTFADRGGDIVNAVTTGLAGAGNVGTVPEGSGKLGGAFYGVGKALQGVQAQQNAQAEQKERSLNSLSDREYKHALAMKENIDMFHQQQVAHTQSQESQEKMVSTGKQFVDMVTDGPDGAPVLAANIPFSEIQSKLAQNHLDASSTHYQPTSRVQVGTWTNPETHEEEPRFETRYTVLGDRPNPMTPVNADFASRWNTVFPDEKISEGTSLPYETLSAKAQQMDNYVTAQTARNKQMGDFEMSKEQEERAVDSIPFIRSSAWINALAHAGGDQHKALQAIESDPNSPILKAYPNVHDLVIGYNGGEKQWDDQTKTIEQQRHDRAEEEINLIKANGEAAKNNPPEIEGNANLNGKDYIASLPAGRQDLIRSIVSGHLNAVSPRVLSGKEGILLMAEATHADPDFDSSKVAGYGKVYNDFHAGKSADQIQAINIVVPHLARLYDAVNAIPQIPIVGTSKSVLENEAKLFPDSPSGKAARAVIDAQKQASEELAAVYSKGAVTDQEHKKFAEELETTSPGDLRNSIGEVLELLRSKQQGLQSRWDDAAPSPSYKPPVQIISPEAQGSLDHIYLMHDEKMSGDQIPPAAVLGQLKPGYAVNLQNGQSWTRGEGGRPVLLNPQQ